MREKATGIETIVTEDGDHLDLREGVWVIWYWENDDRHPVGQQ